MSFRIRSTAKRHFHRSADKVSSENLENLFYSFHAILSYLSIIRFDFCPRDVWRLETFPGPKSKIRIFLFFRVTKKKRWGANKIWRFSYLTVECLGAFSEYETRACAQYAGDLSRQCIVKWTLILQSPEGKKIRKALVLQKKEIFLYFSMTRSSTEDDRVTKCHETL